MNDYKIIPTKSSKKYFTPRVESKKKVNPFTSENIAAQFEIDTGINIKKLNKSFLDILKNLDDGQLDEIFETFEKFENSESSGGKSRKTKKRRRSAKRKTRKYNGGTKGKKGKKGKKIPIPNNIDNISDNDFQSLLNEHHNSINNTVTNENPNVTNETPHVTNETPHVTNENPNVTNVTNENPVRPVETSDLGCSICFESLNDPTQTYLLHEIGNVPHSFHVTCLNKWIKECIKNRNYRPSCPICRKSIGRNSAIDIVFITNRDRYYKLGILSLSIVVYIFYRVIFPRIPYLTLSLDATLGSGLFYEFVNNFYEHYNDTQHTFHIMDAGNKNKDKYGNFLIEILEKIIEYKHGIDTKEIEKAITYIKNHKIEDKL